MRRLAQRAVTACARRHRGLRATGNLSGRFVFGVLRFVIANLVCKHESFGQWMALRAAVLRGTLRGERLKRHVR
jgi:hypothetical protein